MKYIGIRGHRGSGKNTIAYLLANTIQYFIDNQQEIDFDTLWSSWCDKIIENEHDAIDNITVQNVYLESFGFLPKMLVELITSIPHNYIESDYYKDHLFINIKDLSWEVIDDLSKKPLTADIYSLTYTMFQFEGDVKVYARDPILSLRDFIVYFAKFCMHALGKDIWVKAMRNNEINNYDDIYNIGQKFKIFTDVKAPSELSYIKEKNGIVIKVTRPDNIKEDRGVELLKDDNRWDFEIQNTNIKNDESFKRSIIDIAKYIINEK